MGRTRICALALFGGLLLLQPAPLGAAPARALTQTLSVAVTGNGKVTSSPAGIDCPKTCSSDFKDGESVSLSETPNPGWHFGGWSGDCSGTSKCTVTMDVKRSVGATFAQDPTTTTTATTTAATTTAATTTTPAPPPQPRLVISATSVATGQPVTFDASSLGGHDYKWDLNGDGVFERHTFREPRVRIAYGKPGSYGVGVSVTAPGGGTSVFTGAVVVTGTASASCGVYCATIFPWPAGAGDCQHELTFGVVSVRAEGCLASRPGGGFTTTGDVRVNGIDIFPNAGSHVDFDPAGFEITSGGTGVAMQSGELPFWDGAFDWTHLDGTDGRADNVFELSGNQLLGPGFESFNIVGRIHVDLIGPGQSEFGFDLELPDILGDVAAHVRFHADMDNGMALDQLHIHLPTGWISGKLPIQNLDLDYDQEGDAWGGGLAIQLPVLGYTVGGNFGMVHGQFDHAGAEISGLNIHIADGVYLQALRGSVQATPFGFGGGITLSYGPKYLGVDLISADGDFTLTFSDPVVLNMTGSLSVLSLIEIGSAFTRYSADGNLDFGGRLGRTWAPGVSVNLSIAGWVESSGSWNMEGDGQLCLAVCVGGTLLTSSTGLIVCGHFGFFDSGFSYGWLTRTVTIFAVGCDVGPYRPATAGHPSSLLALAPPSVTLPAGLPAEVFAVKGVGGPPSVAVVGPDGTRVATPASGQGSRSARSVVFEDTSSATTFIAVAHPAAGVWRVESLPGLAPIRSVRVSSALPRPHVTASVSGRGRHRVLHYAVAPLPGQRVVFVERGLHANRVLGVAKGARGTIAFVPGAGKAGRRTIVALVQQNGLGRKSIAVARYNAPAALRLGAPRKLTLTRTRTELRISWPAVAGARGYKIDVMTSDNRHLLAFASVRTRSYTVLLVEPRDTVKVSVAAVDRGARAGTATRAVSGPRA